MEELKAKLKEVEQEQAKIVERGQQIEATNQKLIEESTALDKRFKLLEKVKAQLIAGMSALA